MYRVLIVDDEPEIRTGIRLKADWESVGARVVGEAQNGQEAMDWLVSEPVDIVITDMNMPVMGGGAFMAACRELMPDVKLIVITGYEDFHYAQAAVKHKAEDYLLKPVAQDELMQVLRSAVGKLEQERNALRQREQTEWRMSQYFNEMKEHYLLSIVNADPENERSIAERAKLFELEGLRERKVRFVTAGLRTQSSQGGMGADERTPDKLRHPFELLCKEFASSHPFRPETFRDRRYPGLTHFILAEEGVDDASAAAFTAELRACVNKYLAFDPAVGTGASVAGFLHWREGYMTSLAAWSLTHSKVDDVEKGQQEGKSFLTEDFAKTIHGYVVRGELQRFDTAIHKVLTEVCAESQKQLVKFIFQLGLSLDALAHANGMVFEDTMQLWLQPDQVLRLNTVDKAKRFLFGLAEGLHSKLAARAVDSDYSAIHTAKQFIDHNYMYDINLNMLAEKFSYNPSYFSELFKSKVGKTFIQYMTEVRMKEAVRLLTETDLGLWDIAELSGFSNASYFSSKFKKIHGMAPSEFRLALSKKSDNDLPKK